MRFKVRPDVPRLALFLEPELHLKRAGEGFLDLGLAKEVKLHEDSLANVEGSYVEALHPGRLSDLGAVREELGLEALAKDLEFEIHQVVGAASEERRGSVLEY